MWYYLQGLFELDMAVGPASWIADALVRPRAPKLGLERAGGPGPPGVVKRPFAFSIGNRFCMVVFYRRTERLTALFGGLDPRRPRIFFMGFPGGEKVRGAPPGVAGFSGEPSSREGSRARS